MAPEPAVAPGKGKPAAKGKGLSLKSPWTWVIIGGVALVGGAFILWRQRSKAAASSGGSSSGASPDYSGALGTLQDEIGNLQGSAGGFGGGTSVVPVTTPSGGGGTTTTTDTGPSSGGNSPGSSGGSSGGSSSGGSSSGSSSGGSSSGSGSGSAPATSRVYGGHVVSVNNNDAVLAWSASGPANAWKVQLTGPGPLNGRTNTVPVTRAVYSGLEAGHNYHITVQPMLNGSPDGTPGTIDFQTTR